LASVEDPVYQGLDPSQHLGLRCGPLLCRQHLAQSPVEAVSSHTSPGLGGETPCQGPGPPRLAAIASTVSDHVLGQRVDGLPCCKPGRSSPRQNAMPGDGHRAWRSARVSREYLISAAMMRWQLRLHHVLTYWSVSSDRPTCRSGCQLGTLGVRISACRCRGGLVRKVKTVVSPRPFRIWFRIVLSKMHRHR